MRSRTYPSTVPVGADVDGADPRAVRALGRRHPLEQPVPGERAATDGARHAEPRGVEERRADGGDLVVVGQPHPARVGRRRGVPALRGAGVDGEVVGGGGDPVAVAAVDGRLAGEEAGHGGALLRRPVQAVGHQPGEQAAAAVGRRDAHAAHQLGAHRRGPGGALGHGRPGQGGPGHGAVARPGAERRDPAALLVLGARSAAARGTATGRPRSPRGRSAASRRR